MEKFGTLVRKYREANGWTQAHLAERADIGSSATVSHAESNEYSSNKETVAKLAKAFRLSGAAREEFEASATWLRISRGRRYGTSPSFSAGRTIDLVASHGNGTHAEFQRPGAG